MNGCRVDPGQAACTFVFITGCALELEGVISAECVMKP